MHYQAIDVDVVSHQTPANEASLLLPSNTVKKGSVWTRLSKNKSFSLVPSLMVGAAIWFGVTPSQELTLTAIHLLAVFSSCIFALITTSVDISMLVLTGLTLLALTHSFECVDHATGILTECRLCGETNPLTGDLFECKAGKESFKQSLEGFSSSVVWLIFAAFHLGKAVQVTNLGRRLSLFMIKAFGKHTLGLAYAIVLSELILAPFVPSNTARGGGIVLPVVHSIATTLGSTPDSNPEIGTFLFLVGNHANLLSASMYLTGKSSVYLYKRMHAVVHHYTSCMAANPIVVAKANQLFPDINFGFMTWLQGSIVPSIVCAICIPLIVRWSLGLDTDTPTRGKHARGGDNVVEHAQMELRKMGPVSAKEWWDTLFWLGGFVTIAQQLSEAGASSFLGHKISFAIQHFNLPPVASLAVSYFLTTFMFSSLSAHTVAFVATFLDAGHALGAQPMILTAFISYFGALGGCMTNFSTGMAAMYYAPGYVARAKWFTVGLQMAVFYLCVYFTVGLAWWTFLGWSQ
ncbi:hypothetical protein [Parasitella parasitica]|uniref:Citrate transporter-like domain-containing protein n=1 Tax=Parasitella parasitica TaxID=35722 RepID=A0A0B7NTP5_9FUNG|nr:hypothetical protein [Parasitella parasitica]